MSEARARLRLVSVPPPWSQLARADCTAPETHGVGDVLGCAPEPGRLCASTGGGRDITASERRLLAVDGVLCKAGEIVLSREADSGSSAPGEAGRVHAASGCC